MKFAQKIFYIYCAAFSVFLTISGFAGSSSPQELIMQAIFLPISAYFILNSVKLIRTKKFDLGFTNKKMAVILPLIGLLALLGISIGNVMANNQPYEDPYSEDNITTFTLSHDEEQTKNDQIVVSSPSAQLKVKVTTDDERIKTVNIRKLPTTSSKKLGEAEVGTSYDFISENNYWVEIDFDTTEASQSGWLHKNYTQIIKQQ